MYVCSKCRQAQERGPLWTYWIQFNEEMRIWPRAHFCCEAQAKEAMMVKAPPMKPLGYGLELVDA